MTPTSNPNMEFTSDTLLVSPAALFDQDHKTTHSVSPIVEKKSQDEHVCKHHEPGPPACISIGKRHAIQFMLAVNKVVWFTVSLKQLWG